MVAAWSVDGSSSVPAGNAGGCRASMFAPDFLVELGRQAWLAGRLFDDFGWGSGMGALGEVFGWEELGVAVVAVT